MSNLIGIYIVKVYDDGSIETERQPLEITPLPKDGNFINTAEISNKMGQILVTLKYLVADFEKTVFEDDDTFFIGASLRRAMERTCGDYKVGITSVTDKFSRALSMPLDETREYLREYLKEQAERKNTEDEPYQIEKILLDSISDRTGKKDIFAVRKFFRDTKIPIILKDGRTI